MILRDELTNDPESMGYDPMLAAGSHNAVAALLNEPRYETLGSIPITPLLEWITANVLKVRLQAASYSLTYSYKATVITTKRNVWQIANVAA